jgi:carbamoylphosphate synthase small subunit
MTDPSYRGQVLVFTQPLIGNYGVPAFTKDCFGLYEHFESEKIQVSGIVVNDYSTKVFI